MNSATALDSAQRFFNDLIGVLIPGLTLLALAAHFFQVPALPGMALGGLSSWVLVVIGAYVVGHVVISVGESLLQPTVDRIVGIRLLSWLRYVVAWSKTKRELYSDIDQSETYQAATRRLEGITGANLSQGTVRDARNVAMSLLPPSENEKVYKFVFTAQLCLGVATAILLVIIVVAFLELTDVLLMQVGLSAPGWLSTTQSRGLWSFLVPLVASRFLLERWQRFHSIGLRVPFSMFLGQVGRIKLESGP